MSWKRILIDDWLENQKTTGLIRPAGFIWENIVED